MRLHIEQREDGTLKGYGFYTGNNPDWQMIDVVQFQSRGHEDEKGNVFESEHWYFGEVSTTDEDPGGERWKYQTFRSFQAQHPHLFGRPTNPLSPHSPPPQSEPVSPDP
ncbi:hypothetical protein [Pseudomonas sp. 8 R 14]|nr:S-type pyocin domain-containing protein [Pseudomonas sp. 8 R 14]CRM44854.1 hypothetical protein [Pseudomonas sp. 8 R 14]